MVGGGGGGVVRTRTIGGHWGTPFINDYYEAKLCIKEEECGVNFKEEKCAVNLSKKAVTKGGD